MPKPAPSLTAEPSDIRPPSPEPGFPAGFVRGLEPTLAGATRAAALACQPWVGRGDGKRADGAATDAMRRVLGDAPWRGVVVIGEGEKDDAPMLFTGERVGAGAGPPFDIAVDPLECTTYCAAGVPGSLSTIAAAAPGAMWSPGPAFYMEKLVVPGAAREAIDIADSPEANLARVADALDRPLESLRVVVLDSPATSSSSSSCAASAWRCRRRPRATLPDRSRSCSPTAPPMC